MDITNLRIVVSAETGSALGQLTALSNTINALKSQAQGGIGFQRISADLKNFIAILNKADISNFASQMQVIGDAAAQVSIMLSQVSAMMAGMTTQESENLDEIQSRFASINSEVSKLSSNIGSANTQMTAMGREAQKSQKKVSFLSKTIQSIGRIAFYRLVRGTLMSLFNGIADGMKNLAQYSTSFQKTMSGFSTEALYLKNSFATMIQPLIAVLQPVLIKVGDLFADLFAKASMFFNYLAGNATYTKALKYWTEYDNGVKDTTSSVKKLKASVLGFDELNVLSDNSDSSSSSSGSTANVADMFETLDMPSTPKWWGNVKEGLIYAGGVLSDAWDLIKKIGISMSGWSIPAKVTTALATLASLLTFGAGGTIALAFAVAISYNLGKKIGMGTATSKDFAAALCTVLGATFIGFKMGGAIGAVIGFAVSVISLAVGIYQGAVEKAKAELLKDPVFKSLSESVEVAKEVTLKVSTNIDLRNDGLAELSTKYQTAKDLIDKIFALVNQDADIPKIQKYVDTLNGLGFGTLLETTTLLNGDLSSARKEAKTLLETMMRLSVINYASNNYGQALVDQRDLQNQYNIVSENLSKALQKTYNKAVEFLTDFLGSKASSSIFEKAQLSYGNDIEGLQNFIIDTAYGWSEFPFAKLLASGIDFKAYYDEYNNARTTLGEAENKLSEVNKQIIDYSDLMSGYFIILEDGTIKTFSDIAKENGFSIQNEAGLLFGYIEGDAKDLTDYINTLTPYLDIEITDTEAIVKGDINRINTLLANANLPTLEIYVEMKTEDIDLGWANGLGIDGITWDKKGNAWGTKYATGGFPEDGLFFANHGEMVGQFSNGKNVVANNEQIVSGIAEGVYNAMMRANGANNGGDTVIPIYIDNQLTATKVISASQKANRKAGRTILPIGG